MQTIKSSPAGLSVIPIIFLLLIAGCASVTTTTTLKVPIPQRSGYVNDFSSIFPPTVKDRIEVKLREYEEKTGRTVLFVSLPVLDCVFYEDICAREVYHAWGLGKNAIILFVSGINRKERTYLGLGGDLTIDDVPYNQFILGTLEPLIKAERLAEAYEAYLDFILLNLHRLSK